MKFAVSLPSNLTPQVAINRCGYATFRDPRTGEQSFVRRPGSYFSPRFHVYLEWSSNQTVIISLHLDQKQPTYQRGHAHSGEYNGETVRAEAQRIVNTITSLSAP